MKIIVDPNYNLGKLQKWLTIEMSGFILLILIYLPIAPAIYKIVLVIYLIAALALLPLLLKVLLNEKKYGWIIFFLIFVIGSGLAASTYLSNADWMLHSSVVISSLLVSLMFFYFYCGLLKLAIPQWFHDEEFDAA